MPCPERGAFLYPGFTPDVRKTFHADREFAPAVAQRQRPRGVAIDAIDFVGDLKRLCGLAAFTIVVRAVAIAQAVQALQRNLLDLAHRE